MKHLWHDWARYFDSFSPRRKVAIAAVLLAVVYGAFYLLIFAPMMARNQSLSSEITLLARELNNLTAQEKVLSQGVSQDSRVQKVQTVKGLKQRVDELDQRLESLSLGLIGAHQLPIVLRDVLRQRGNLELVSMRAMPAEPMQVNNTPSSDIGETVEVPAILFKHRVSLRLRGKFFDLQQYLTALESGPWRFYWERLDYRVDTYPKAEVTLNVFTLSLDQGMLSEANMP